MGANDFSVTVEKLDSTCGYLSDLSGWFSGMGSLVDPSRAQAASDSPLSSGALASFSETMVDALRTTAKLLQEDRTKLAKVADGYRSVDQLSARSSEVLKSGLTVESTLPTLSVRQSQVTYAILEGVAGLDDAIVPAARIVTGASDRVQESLRSGADFVRRTANRTADDIGEVDPVAGLGVRVIGAASAEALRRADRALESAEDVVRDVATWAEDLSARADRVLIRPKAPASR
jgi:hypothetical protein